MRQLGSGSQLENSKFYTSMERDNTLGNISRMAVSQSAPHTPVSAPSHLDGVLRTVPRLLSEPIVSDKMNKSPGAKSLESKSCKLERKPRYLDKCESVDQYSNVERNKVVRAGSVCVPVHSPKFLNKIEARFSLKSPLAKRDSKLENDKANRVNSTDGTDV